MRRSTVCILVRVTTWLCRVEYDLSSARILVRAFYVGAYAIIQQVGTHFSA